MRRRNRNRHILVYIILIVLVGGYFLIRSACDKPPAPGVPPKDATYEVTYYSKSKTPGQVHYGDHLLENDGTFTLTHVYIRQKDGTWKVQDKPVILNLGISDNISIRRLK